MSVRCCCSVFLIWLLHEPLTRHNRQLRSTCLVRHPVDCGPCPIETVLAQGEAAAWERLIHSFGQRRQLPVLAKHVPTDQPRLRNTAYEMVGAPESSPCVWNIPFA